MVTARTTGAAILTLLIMGVGWARDASALADLVPTVVTPASLILKVGETVSISFTVENQGDATASPNWTRRCVMWWRIGQAKAGWSSRATPAR